MCVNILASPFPRPSLSPLQKESDTVLDDVACMLGCTRSCLNVVASEKVRNERYPSFPSGAVDMLKDVMLSFPSMQGLVVGRIQFHEDGDYIDCTRMGVGGKAIPPYIDKITNVQSDAKFILVRNGKESLSLGTGLTHPPHAPNLWRSLSCIASPPNNPQLIEKEAAYMRLAEDRFYNKYPCIVITAKGQPDVATRLFLKKIKTELDIPVLGLVDSDPYGESLAITLMSLFLTDIHPPFHPMYRSQDFVSVHDRIQEHVL